MEGFFFSFVSENFLVDKESEIFLLIPGFCFLELLNGLKMTNVWGSWVE